VIPFEKSAIFLDLDGTIAPFETTPSAVGPLSARTLLLRRAVEALDGRLAVISGRSLHDIDHILEGAVVPVAAVHGLNRRNAAGEVFCSARTSIPDGVRAALAAFASHHPGVLLEDKRQSIALHFRNAPDSRRDIHVSMSRLAAESGLWLQEGALVLELRAPGPNKGDALRAFMGEAPFAGASPIFVGDDLTDEDAFAEATALGGYGILVGPERPSHALRRLESTDMVFDWLAGGITARSTQS
jgi:trehalose 6-phosphate phosphatase